jgi:hypothetical protein
VSAFFGGCGKLTAIFELGQLPLLRNARKRDKTNRAKQPRGEKKGREKKQYFLG